MYKPKKCEHDMVEDECLSCLRATIEDLRDELNLIPAPIIALKQMCKQSDIYMNALAQIAQNSETLEEAQGVAMDALHSRWGNEVWRYGI